jgi:Cdc6-like AAA superfamily ATPase
MTTPRLRTWFHLKDPFTSFKLIPREHEHARYLFGVRDKKLRDDLLMSLKECAYSEQGYHAIIWGPSGRGKTHLANNLLISSKEEALPLELVYADCPTIRSAKEPLRTLFGPIFRSIPPETVRSFVLSFVNMVKAGHPEWKDQILEELNHDPTIYKAIVDGLVLPTDETIRGVLGWLGGENYSRITNISENAPEQIEDGGQIARNLGALGKILLLSEGKNLIFLIDEAERLQTIQSGEQYWIWLSALRESFRRPMIGLILFVISDAEDYLPRILWEPEIISRISANNIFPSPPFAQPDAESFLEQLLKTMIMREPMPQPLEELLNEAGEDIEHYPFTKEAYEEFIQHHSVGADESKPQELLNNLERAAQRTITLGKKLIDIEALQEVIHGI